MLPVSPLAPVGNHIYNGGKDVAKLSALDRAVSVRTIYEAIRYRDPAQRLRAGYTGEGDPYLAFVSKKSFFAGTIKAYNIVQQRLELRNILFKVCEAGLSSLKNLPVHERTVVTGFRDQMRAGDPTRDLRVRDVLPVVKMLANRTERNQIRNERQINLRQTYSPTVADRRRIEQQRITQFLQEGHPTREILRKALTRDQDKGPEVAQRAVSALVRLFIKIQTTKGAPLQRIATIRASDENLKIFAERWMYLRDPRPATRKIPSVPFCDHPWSLVLDKVAKLVLRAAATQNPQRGQIDGSVDPVRTIYTKSIASSDGTAQGAAPVVAQVTSASTPSESEDESDVLVASPPQGYSPRLSPAASPMTQVLKNAGKLSGNLSPRLAEDMAEKGDAIADQSPDSGRKTPKSKARKSLSRLGRSTKRLTRIFNSPVFNSPNKSLYVSRSDIQRLLGGSPVEWLTVVPSPSSPANMTLANSSGWQPPIPMSPTRAALASIVTPTQGARSTTAFANQSPSSLSPEPDLEVVDKQAISGREYSPLPLPIPNSGSAVFSPLNTSSTQDSPVRLSSRSNSISDVGSAPSSGLSDSSTDGEKGSPVPKD